MGIACDDLVTTIRQLVTNRDSRVIRVLRGVDEPSTTIGAKAGKIVANRSAGTYYPDVEKHQRSI